ncbi:MAG TPA: HEAT repeat domain-containing protein [Tepidisphaeraceae bacterium]|nr:HEAT repeat domain-containing protein [Tepidisphaeraceae bacterium]
MRLQVASALAVLNDAEALVPLLTQLRQERDPSVRAEIARALAPIRDIRAVPTLLELLADPSDDAAAAAALALREMGSQIAADPELRRRVAAALIAAFESRTSGGPSGMKTFPLREALLRAMIPLKDESVAPLMRRVLSARPRETARAREAAIEGLAEFGPRESEPIIGQLDDDDPAVRRRAVRALPRVTTFGDVSERLRRRLDPATEPDGSIRNEAWNALSVLINDATAQQLAPWVDRFADEPERQRFILLRLALLAEQIGDQDELAARRQQIGDSYLRLRLPGDAAEYYEQALEYSIRSRAPTLVLLTRSEATLDALLGARQYDRAAALAGRMIALNPGEFVTSMGGKIALEADRLTRAGEYDSAQRLIERARAIDPPLPDRIIDRLRETEQDIQRFRSEPRPNR